MKKDVIDYVNDCSYVRKCENNVQKDVILRYCYVYVSLNFIQESELIDRVVYLIILIVKRFFKYKNIIFVDNNFYNFFG